MRKRTDRGDPLSVPIVMLMLVVLPCVSSNAAENRTGQNCTIGDKERPFAPASVDEVFDHFASLAASSPFVRWIEHGSSSNGNSLGYAAVASPERLEHLDEIQEGLTQLGDPRIMSSARAHQDLIGELPAVVWLTCSVHGDELAPADAACRLVSLLASETDPGARTIRDSLVVLIDPLRNPDGRERALAERRQWRSRHTVSDDHSLHHRSLWPSDRGNHYFIDPNRDAWRLSQPETRLRARELIRWQPQVVVDLHEMRAYDTYLFSPPDDPFPPFVSPLIHHWWDLFSHAIARVLTAQGVEYYRGDWHESFAPDRLVAWALRMGSTGILLEVPGVDGTQVEQPDGTVLTYEAAVGRHLLAALTILDTAAHHRTTLLRAFRDLREDVTRGKHLAENDGRIALSGDLEGRFAWLPKVTIEAAPSTGQPGIEHSHQRTPTPNALSLGAGHCRWVLIPPSRNEARRRQVIDALSAQGIEIGVTEAAITSSLARDHTGTAPNRVTFPPGTYVVDLHQPLGTLAASLLDPVPAMAESTLLRERRSLVMDDRSILSQYTAWSLPWWSDVETWYTASLPTTEIASSDPRSAQHAGLNRETQKQLLLRQWAESHAFLFDSADDAALSAALRLIEQGVGIRASEVGFRANGTLFAPGSIIVPTHGRNDAECIVDACIDAGVIPIPIELGLTEHGPDLGSRSVVPVETPRIALLSGFGTSASALGWLWFLFDQEGNWPVSLLPIQGIMSADLTNYNAIILPDAPEESGRRLREIIGAESWNRVLDWVSFGGTLILCGESMAALPQTVETPTSHIAIRREVLAELTQLQRQAAENLLGKELLDGHPRSQWSPSWLPSSVGTPEEATAWDAAVRRFAPNGAFLRLDANTDHWLAAGLTRTASIPVRTRQAYHALPPAVALASFERGAALCASGLLWPEAIRRWEGSAALVREKIGSGQMIGIAGDFKHGSPVLERLVMNATLLGPTFVGL